MGYGLFGKTLVDNNPDLRDDGDSPIVFDVSSGTPEPDAGA